jgi:hypothetical protein
MKKIITLSSLLCCFLAIFLVSNYSIDAAFGGEGGGIIIDTDVTVEVYYIDTEGNIIDNNINDSTTEYSIEEYVIEQKNISNYTFKGYYFNGELASGGSSDNLLTTNPPIITGLLGDLQTAPPDELTYKVYMVYSKDAVEPPIEPKETYIIQYHPNGGNGEVIDIVEYLVGDKIIVKNADVLKRELHSFNGWNTEPDGSGQHYLPGAEIEVLERDGKTRAMHYMTLYAQWTPYVNDEKPNDDKVTPDPIKKPNVTVNVERSSKNNISPATNDNVKYELYFAAMGITCILFYVVKKKYMA